MFVRYLITDLKSCLVYYLNVLHFLVSSTINLENKVFFIIMLFLLLCIRNTWGILIPSNSLVLSSLFPKDLFS